MKYFYLFIFTVTLLFSNTFANAQNYELVWEDNFDGTTLDSSKWNTEQRIGIWNTGGNNEFQHYRKENVTVGNDGEGNNCLVITAKKEKYNGYNYTSGRVNTKGKMAFRRGKIEAMIKIPNLANGLWPAFWTLGYTPNGWPDCGEIDILEMGHKKGIETGKQNSFIGSHLFWGPYPRDYGETYTASQNLSQGYYKHTVIWTETRISTYFNDSATPYFSMGINGDDTEEFRDFQNYIIFNLAVGGSVPGIANESGITASFPASMYVDWVKVYQETGKTDIKEKNLPLYGMFGIYEDEAGVDMRMTNGFDLFVSTQGLSVKTGETPKAGSNVLAYNFSSAQNFELKLTSGTPRNFINYTNGSIQFQLKTDVKTDLQIGVSDASGRVAFVPINAATVIADGKWHLYHLPVSEIVSYVDISALSDVLIIKGNSPSDGTLLVDEVVFSETVPAAGYFGIYTNNSNITNSFLLDDVSGHLYNWDGTVSFNSVYPAFDGTDVLSFRSSGVAAWWGFGLFSQKPLNFENYSNGYLNLMLRTVSTETFKIAVNGANNTAGDVEFKNGSDPYGFVRDGKWHQLQIPMTDLTKKGLDLSACGNIFTISGGKTTDIGVDDIYLSESASLIENPDTCYAVSLTISPKDPTIKIGAKKKFTAKATNQFGNPADAYVTWESSGGTILQDGNFSAADAGAYTVTARMGALSDNTTVTVEDKTDVDSFKDQVLMSYSSSTRLLSIDGLKVDNQIEVYNLIGARIYSSKAYSSQTNIDMSIHPFSTYFIKILNGKDVVMKKFINR